MKKHIIDLSVTIAAGMPVFPGDPGVQLVRSDVMPDAFCQVTQMSMSSHTGTHIDTPRHFLADGATIPEVSLDSFVGDAVCIQPNMHFDDGRGIIDLDEESCALMRKHDRVLFHTGWGQYRKDPKYYTEYPVFSDASMDFLLKKEPILIGADLPTLSGPGSPFAMHVQMFSKGIVFVENLHQLDLLIGKRFFFSAAPLKIDEGDGSPVRAYAIVDA